MPGPIDLDDVQNHELEHAQRFVAARWSAPPRGACPPAPRRSSSPGRRAPTRRQEESRRRGGPHRLLRSVQPRAAGPRGVPRCGPDPVRVRDEEGPAPSPASTWSAGARPRTPRSSRLDLPFYAKQQKVVLSNAGLIDPDRIEDYVAIRGLPGAAEGRWRPDPAGGRRRIDASGSGAGAGPATRRPASGSCSRRTRATRSTWWSTETRVTPAPTWTAPSWTPTPPRARGSSLAGYATGASQGFIYVRAEYPLAIERLERAIRAAKKAKILGRSVLGSDFRFDIEVRVGAGAFVCGEETALMASIEGERGTPSLRPPYPTERACGAPRR
jgi:bidirectional [NiFe] hydrogenase diaphorase subunit